MMKHHILIKGLAVIISMAFFSVGCSEDEDPTPEELQKLSFTSEQVLSRVPDGLKNSSDTYAQSCYDFIESACDMSLFSDNMEVPENATRSSKKSTTAADSWQWTWHYGGESFTFYWTYDEDASKHYWTMEIQFGSGPRYNYIDAWETKDGTQGEVVYNWGWAAIYGGEEVSEDDFIYLKYTWNLDASGVYHVNYILEGGGEDYEAALQYTVQINADGSGEVNYYMMDSLLYHMEWDVLGNGSWVYYIGGEEYMSGAWAAG